MPQPPRRRADATRAGGARAEPPRRLDLPGGRDLPAPVALGLVLRRDRPRPPRPGAGRGRDPGAAPRPVGERDAAAHDLRPRQPRRGQPARSGGRGRSPTRRATSRPRASPNLRSSRWPRPASRVSSTASPAARSSPRSCPRSSATTSGSTVSRDPRGSGLVTLIHPWECGLDTTPPWMQALGRMREPWWMRATLALHLARVVRFLRRDTRYIPANERPSDDDGLRMLVLAHRARRSGFELRRMPVNDSVLIEDVAFNAILGAANRALRELAGEADIALGSALDSSMTRTETRARRALARPHRSIPLAGRDDRRPDHRPHRRHLPAALGRCHAGAGRAPRRAARRARLVAAVPGPERAHRLARVRRGALLEGPDVGEHQLDDRPGSRAGGRGRAGPGASGRRRSAWLRTAASGSTSRRGPGRASAPAGSPGPRHSPST